MHVAVRPGGRRAAARAAERGCGGPCAAPGPEGLGLGRLPWAVKTLRRRLPRGEAGLRSELRHGAQKPELCHTLRLLEEPPARC